MKVRDEADIIMKNNILKNIKLDNGEKYIKILGN